MDGLVSGGAKAHYLGNKAAGIDVKLRSGARRAMPDDAAAVLGSDHSERGGARVGAAFAAT